MDQTFDQASVGQSRERIARLLSETLEERVASKEHLQRVIEELSTGLEELIVAEEELRVQADELQASTAAIDAERERYGELFEFAPDAYLVTDVRGKIQEANSGASTLLGVSSRYLDGKLLVSFVAEPDRRVLRDLLNELAEPAKDSGVLERRVRLQPREGETFEAEVRAGSRLSLAGEPEIRWMVRDVTQRLELEEEIRFLNAEVELLTSLARVARLTAAPEPIETLLNRVIELAGRALEGCEVSIAIAGTDSTRFPCASGERAEALDRAQQLGNGPSGTALTQNRVVEAAADGGWAEWPGFGDAARAAGVALVIAHPLATPSGRRGALNVYGFGDLPEKHRRMIPLLADQVAVALANSELYESAHALAGHLEKALESRGVIEQAKGILMARQGCSDDEAFDILRRASQRLNRKLRDVATELVHQVRVTPARGGESTEGKQAALARAAAFEGRARARAVDERQRATLARAAGKPRSAALHEKAEKLHERAAKLQQEHQGELESGEVKADERPPADQPR